MTRVLLTADAVGGVWQYATDLAAGLKPLGFDPVVAVMGPSPSACQVDAAKAAGLELIDTGLPLDWLAQDVAEVRRAAEGIAALANDVQADIVQLNAPALAGLADFVAPTVTVAHSCVATWWSAVEHGALPSDFTWRTDLVRRGLAQADRIVAPSAAFAAALRQTYGLSTSPLVVHNGRAPLPVPTAAMHDYALTVGRLWDRAKGLATLDEAAALVSVPIKAVGSLSGPDGTRQSLKHAHAVGSVDALGLAELLAPRPVFVSAARYEPFGLAVLEAAQAGCALVLSDMPTFRELWDGAATFVDPADSRGFADAIDQLIGDARLRLDRGQTARERAGRYSVGAMASGMAQIFRSLDARRAAA
jgi:glycosyltransferase involved in cell wall biosynthesis